jgi:hypothetical protein
MRVAGLLLIVFIGAAFHAPQQPTDAVRFRTGTAVLTGTVVVDEPNGPPLKRAVITVVVGNQANLQYEMTDDRGRFTVAGLPAANVRLTANKPGYVTTYYGAKQPGSTVGVPIALTVGTTTDVTVRVPRGAAIAGTVTDHNGDPMPSVGVRVQRVTMSVLGQRVLTPTPGALVPTTDDRGAYRIFPLPAGDYVVMAQPRFAGPGEVRQTSAAELDWAERQLRLGAAGAPAATQKDAGAPAPSQTITYASVFFPGTVNVSNATVISLAAGQERNGADLRMQFVPTARVEGTVTTADGQPARGLQVMLIPESDGGVSLEAERAMVLMEVGLLFGTLSTTAADGSFSLQGVEPGGYTVLARRAAGGRGAPVATTSTEAAWAMTDIRVDGRDITGVAMRLAAGQTVSGRIVLEGSAASTARASVGLSPVSQRGVGVTTPAVEVGPGKEAFAVSGLIPAPYRLRVTAAGWTLKSAMLGKRDVADHPLEIEPGENITDLVLTLTSSPAELGGILYDGANRPSSDLTIVLFAVDRAMWFQGSRRVRPAVRPASDGRFSFTGLVGGEYYLAALTDVSPADLVNPQFLEQVVPAAFKLTIADGEKKTQDLRIAGK